MRAGLPVEPPVDIGREQAASEAARELSKPRYGQAGDSLLSRALQQVLEWIGDLFGQLARNSPTDRTGVVVLAGLIVLVAVVVFWRAGALRTTPSESATVFDTDAPRTAAQYRAEAQAAAAVADFAAAVRSGFRACIAELTERTVLDDRPGRTAYEAAADAGRAVPALAQPLRLAATVFTEVVYGNRPATPERYAVVVAADEAARRVSTRSLLQGAAP